MSKYLQNNQKIAFIKANWHGEIVQRGLDTFLEGLESHGINRNQVEIFDVPGSLEIPLLAKKLAETGDYAGVACGGFIINGGIYHHEYVNHAVIDGLMRVMLDTGVPVWSMVLTPLNFHQSEPHHEFFFNHFVIKGKELAEACVQTLEYMQKFSPKVQAAA